MKTWAGWLTGFVLVVLLQPAIPAWGAPPLSSLLPFRRVEADPVQSYELRDEHGPWLILAASFVGERAEEQAHELVLELRRRYHWPAYIHRQEYDFTQSVKGLTLDEYGQPARMRYANGGRYEAIAVLVGDFESVDDPTLEKTLKEVKYARPECLDLTKRSWTAQKFSALREWYRRVNLDESKHNKGPMGSAFVTRNPLLPESYFAPNGVDEFVERLNEGVKYSLLDNPGKWTVRVATFRGNDTINQREIAELARNKKVTNKLEIAAEKAHRLTEALRRQGVEAYEFHDRHESIVTIGSFASEGTPLPDGTVQINPAVLQVMQAYGAKRDPIPGQSVFGLKPRQLDGIAFDIQPMPIEVPRRSVANDYARRASLFR